MHHEEFGDRLLGVMGGYLLYSGLVDRARTRSRSSRSSPAAASARSAARSSPSPSTSTSTANPTRTGVTSSASMTAASRRFARCGSGADDSHGVGAAGALALRRGHDRDEIAGVHDAGVARGARARRRAGRRRSSASDRERAHAPHEAEAAERVGLVGAADDRDRRPERGDAARGRAALRRAHDRGDAEIFGGLHRGVRDGPRDPVVVVRGGRARGRRCARSASPRRLPRPRPSCARCRWGRAPTAVSSESMSASVPSITALATSFTSARVGSGERVIDSSICVAVITGLPGHVAEADDLLLDQRHPARRDLDPEVAAGDHHRVGDRDDAGEVIERDRGLDLRDEVRLRRRASAGGRAPPRRLRDGARTRARRSRP